MKNLLQNILMGKTNKLSVLLILTMLVTVGLACKFGSTTESESDKKATPEQKAEDKSEDKNVNDKSKAPITKADASKAGIPDDAELQQMSRTIVSDFNSAIQKEDFTDFRSSVAKPFQKQYTAESFKTNFQGFISRKTEFGKLFDEITDDEMTAAIDEGPKVESKMGYKVLMAKGSYSTYPKTKFEYEFIPEGKDWKLVKIIIKVGIE